MIDRVSISPASTIPLLLKYTDIRSYVFTVCFILLSVLLPWIFHQFHLAGPTFLPMHFFVLLAGLIFGWRAGLIVGLLSPLASNALAGMPGVWLLPQIMVELSVYGLICGVLRERFNLPVTWSLLGAMVGGRLALLIAAVIAYLVVGESNSPLGPELNPLFVVWSAVKQGWPGIVIQIALIPLVVSLTGKLIGK